jgi:hypothetical protein
MLNKLLNKLGYISKAEADILALNQMREGIAQIEAIKPGEEFISASRKIRKYGFKIVYALGDGNAKENAIKLANGIEHTGSPIDSQRIIENFLPNVKIVDDKTLLF